ncbi:hypothetical protein BDQ12DRAFT_708946 [Crucibulum laeve]|uniref:Response regulatory domain-containing protein n=1 Tax=Crucibulum laeve TaxID=68775 RepID=A0A5C3MF80_9AGAR|nr:hypothetical protein BDQ12DRAFT_708946 [Crucibulum laeve]
MSAPKLPALRLPAVSGGECVIQEPVALDPASSNRLIVSYAPEGRLGFTSTTTPSAPPMERPSLSSSEGEAQTSDGGDSGDDESSDAFLTGNAPEAAVPNGRPVRPGLVPGRLPQFSRTLSTPLPRQLSQLQNPHRPSPLARSNSYMPLSQMDESSQFRELSLELADSVQMAIQTMLQISPPQVLDPAKEQFSACSLSIPTPSMSAMFTAMKNLNYISANMEAFAGGGGLMQTEDLPPLDPVARSQNHNDFDIGEMLQCVGDALSGTAAQVGVDLVLYHGDAGLKHVFVSGDESGISYALSHIVRQVLATAESGDSIELGLLIVSDDPMNGGDITMAAPTDGTDDDPMATPPLDAEGPVRCTIRISHKYGSPDSGESEASVATQTRPEPCFATLLLRRLLRQIGANFTPDLPPPKSFTSGRTCELSVTLDRGDTPAQTPSGESGEESSEPTLDHLAAFGETLKGKRVTLYASAKGSFAQHLTSYLTAWGMDVSHVSPEGNVDGVVDAEVVDIAAIDARINPIIPTLSTYGSNTETIASTGIPGKIEARHAVPEPPSFIFIDDDINILKERLHALHAEKQPQTLNLNPRKRPSLAAHHRPKSSPAIARLLGQNIMATRPTPVVIMHFTSISNYKVIKDIVQSVMVTYAASATPLPEVMILPKPAGPRRFLTALHTAVMKPAVDPFFMPIATSPMSPSVQGHGSFFHNLNEGNPLSQPSVQSPGSGRPSGSRSNSDRSNRSGKDTLDHPPAHPPASPLGGLPDNVEYFSEAAVRLGSSPSSGLVIQSPDGQPAGIFFHPRGKGSRNSSNSTEKGASHIMLGAPRRGSTSRLPSGENTFSSLHEASTSTPRSPSQIALDSIASPPSASPIPKMPTRKQSSPRSDMAGSIPSRRSPELTRKQTSPPLSPGEGGTPSRRALGKRPMHDATATSASAAKKGKGTADPAAIIPPIKVLIVDDNIINQTILSTFMRKKKIAYDIASNGLQAVQKWRSGEFHLILMDIQMPVMDGIEATKEIRRLEKNNAMSGYPPLTPSEGSRTPDVRTPSDTSTNSVATSVDTRATSSPYRSSVIIVALTASSLQSDRVAALAAGCNDFLTKPVSLLWLNNKIIEWGSIKALQMWADHRPDALKNLVTGQAAQARNIAERLHVPKGRATPSPSRHSPAVVEDNVTPVPTTPTVAPPVSSSALSNPSTITAETASGFFTPTQSTSAGRPFSFNLPSSPKRSNSQDASMSPTSEILRAPIMRRTSTDPMDVNEILKPTGTINKSDESRPDSNTLVAHNFSTQSQEVPLDTEPVKTRENGIKHEQPSGSMSPSSSSVAVNDPTPP